MSQCVLPPHLYFVQYCLTLSVDPPHVIFTFYITVRTLIQSSKNCTTSRRSQSLMISIVYNGFTDYNDTERTYNSYNYHAIMLYRPQCKVYMNRNFALQIWYTVIPLMKQSWCMYIHIYNCIQ